MKKVATICSEIAAKMEKEMLEALEFGYQSIFFDAQFGTAWVEVDMTFEKMRNGSLYPNTEVSVMHKEDNKKSPLLEKAIYEALPTWEHVESIFNSLSY